MACGKQVHVFTRMLKRLDCYLSWGNVNSLKLIQESQATKQNFGSLYFVDFFLIIVNLSFLSFCYALSNGALNIGWT